ncbi:MAG: hydroxyacid dehydrogenase [Halobacteriovoraceae bacterium]|nr:hydroxyacid dehydrogenase [Halobacteriovoraceae bacterium]|tara:strand:- start:4845 stop:5852 length:1008 start_codon:yes stop_codon:yes gene_type:complete
MKIKCFSTHKFEQKYLTHWADELDLKVEYIETSLNKDTVELAQGFDCISCWASDTLDKNVLTKLKNFGVKLISLRSAGYSHIDLAHAQKIGLMVTRVPSYSPEAIAEHTVGLLLCLNRKYMKAFQRVKDFNFTLDGLEGLTLFGKTVGVIGTGKIGSAFARIMKGFGCKILLYDIHKDNELEKELKASYVNELKDLLSQSDIVSLHCPLNESTRYVINSKTIDFLKPTAFLLNTGRGALIDTSALVAKLKKNELRGVGLDVYEHEEDVFFYDHSEKGISDESLLRLMSFTNVLVTSHQGFFTKEALENIARISLENILHYKTRTEIPKENLLTTQ